MLFLAEAYARRWQAGGRWWRRRRRADRVAAETWARRCIRCDPRRKNPAFEILNKLEKKPDASANPSPRAVRSHRPLVGHLSEAMLRMAVGALLGAGLLGVPRAVFAHMGAPQPVSLTEVSLGWIWRATTAGKWPLVHSMAGLAVAAAVWFTAAWLWRRFCCDLECGNHGCRQG